MASKPAPAKDNIIKEEPIKVNKWDGCAVKNSLDDAVKLALQKKFDYQENYALMDGRLAMCSVAVGVAMFAMLWDFLYPFPQSKPVLIICVASYFILMGLLTLYTTFKEKGIFVKATQKDPAGFKPDNMWEASSYIKKYDDKYLLVLTCTDGRTNNVSEASLTKSVACFFDSNGELLQDLVDAEVVKVHNQALAGLKHD
ncbi:signal peptidase complex subunit 2 isoform X2 [Neocloeon triangulifer]|uniref:signal peptidase complex subunit 2 isoform X2 n=1 Tax=Neocloeon triangulifer TaxID=2078957 RepID=UPI00286F0AC5|nr:signal peptidase complex subunit 2 isoform X2 [Neocloeon triangulifer]XP_059476238.1 signal peptidase complex subunit 2 isoform X2 [Neocloeon triangulifer]